MPGFQLVKIKSNKVSIGSLSLVIGLVIAECRKYASEQVTEEMTTRYFGILEGFKRGIGGVP